MQQVLDILTMILIISATPIIYMALYEMVLQMRADRKKRLERDV